MDSTFLGVLAGLALRESDQKQQVANTNHFSLELLNPSNRAITGMD